MLHTTYEQIINGANAIEALQSDQKIASSRLSLCIEIILLLIEIKFKIEKEQKEKLKLFLSPQVDDESEDGWEELTYLSLSQCLKVCMNGGQQMDYEVEGGNKIKQFKDTDKLKKAIQAVCKRISQGTKIEL